MRKLLLLVIIVSAIFTACSSGTPYTESSVSDSPYKQSDTTDFQIDLLSEIDATGIEYIEPNGDFVYIIGVKREKSQPQRELIYAVYDLSKNHIHVLHRDLSSIDGAHNMSVYQNSFNEISIFTGQNILKAQDNQLISIQELDKKFKREAFLDIKNNQMVYINESDLNLYLRRIDEDVNAQPRKLYSSSRIVDEDGIEHILFPYNPRLNNQGDKVLFGVAKDDTNSYQNVMIYDIYEEETAQTENLPINADFLDFLWYEDSFITLEITDSLDGSPSSVGTIFTQYDSSGKYMKKTVLDVMALSCQRKLYPDVGIYVFGYSKNDKGGLALYDIEKNEAYTIYQSDNYIVSPTVSPDGEKILWVENGTLHIKGVASLAYSQSIKVLD